MYPRVIATSSSDLCGRVTLRKSCNDLQYVLDTLVLGTRLYELEGVVLHVRPSSVANDDVPQNFSLVSRVVSLFD